MCKECLTAGTTYVALRRQSPGKANAKKKLVRSEGTTNFLFARRQAGQTCRTHVAEVTARPARILGLSFGCDSKMCGMQTQLSDLTVLVRSPKRAQ